MLMYAGGGGSKYVRKITVGRGLFLGSQTWRLHTCMLGILVLPRNSDYKPYFAKIYFHISNLNALCREIILPKNALFRLSRNLHTSISRQPLVGG